MNDINQILNNLDINSICKDEPIDLSLEDFKRLTEDFKHEDMSGNIKNIDFPDIDISKIKGDTTKVTIDEVTEGKEDGKGAFDILFKTVDLYLRKQLNNDSISGKEYATMFVGSIQATLNSAVQFVLNKDQVYYQSILSSIQAEKAKIEVALGQVQFETAKIQYYSTLAQLNNLKAQYALQKLQIANTHSQYCISRQQAEQLDYEIDASRVKVHNTLRDGTPFTEGLLKTQDDFTKQQITGFQRRSELEVAKIMTDTIPIRLSQDEGTQLPPAFTSSNIEKVIDKLKENVELPATTTP